MTARSMICQECHAVCKPADAFHPYLYCELVKLGHDDPASYLAAYGFARLESSSVGLVEGQATT